MLAGFPFLQLLQHMFEREAARLPGRVFDVALKVLRDHRLRGYQ